MAFCVALVFACVFALGALAKEPKPCCWINQMTGELEVQTDIELEDGTLVLVETKAEFAYDAVFNGKAYIFTEHFANGTTQEGRYVYLFEHGVVYYIEEHEGQAPVCSRKRIPPRFPRSCVPDNAVFLKSLTFGDNALTGHEWHHNLAVRGFTANYTYFVAAEYCVPISYSRVVHNTLTDPPETTVKTTSFTNIELGVCDRDKFFHLPDECPQGSPSVFGKRMLKHVDDLERAFGNTM